VIDPSTIEEIRRRLPLSAIIGERVKLTQRGRSLLGLCPFHKEKTPSFHVNDERGFYHCFGCGASGDSIRFLRETEGLEFIEAVQWLAERAGVQIQDLRSESERREASVAKRQKEELYEIGEAAATYFERCLREHPLSHHATRELVHRGLDPRGSDDIKQALKDFRVGYAPYGWDGLVDCLRRAGASLAAAERVGLVAPRKTGGGYYDRFRHRLMFAVVDLRGHIVAFSGRILATPSAEELAEQGLSAPSTAASENAKYINSPETAIYRKRDVLFGLYQARNAIRESNRCVVVEGNFDVVSLHARGVRNVVAPLGTAFTNEQAAEIKRYSANVTLLFDGDGAGQRASRAAREPCQAQGLIAKVASLPLGTDPDAYSKEHGKEGIERCLKAARSMLEYLIDTTLESGFSAADAHSRAAKIKEVTELIASEEDPTIRALAERHADAIAVRLGIADVRTFQALRASVLRAVQRPSSNAPKSQSVAPPESARSRARHDDIVHEIVGALLEFPELFDDADVIEALGAVDGDAAATIATLHQARSTQPGSAVDLLDRIPQSERKFLAGRLSSPVLDDVDAARAVLLENARRMDRLASKHRDPEVLGQIQKASVSGDIDTQMALLEERFRLERQRRGLKS
jgi:DNA primase